jgi:predicted nucleotidyltransferase
MNVQLAPDHRDEIERIIRRAGVDFDRHRPVLFGSRATGEARRYSDVDIGLAGEPLAMDALARLTDAFEESDLPYRVDVVNLANMSETFQASALADAMPLGSPRQAR